MRFVSLLFISLSALNVTIATAQNPVEEWELEETFFVTRMDIDSNGHIYAVDREQHQIHIFNESGNRIETVGQEGEGPGEFSDPMAIALGPDEERFAVRDKNRRVSLFSRAGTYQSSFVLPQILPSSSMAFANDSLLILGGFQPEAMYVGNTMHLFTTDGTKVRSFFSLYEKAKEFQMTVRVGSGFDVGENNRIYAIQPVDYRISVLSPDGKRHRTIEVTPPEHFRVPTEPQPDPMEDRARVHKWLETVDAPRDVHIVSEDILAVEVEKGGTDPQDKIIDFIEMDSGQVVASWDMEGFPVHADSERERLYVAKPQEEPVTLLHAYRLEDLLK